MASSHFDRNIESLGQVALRDHTPLSQVCPERGVSSLRVTTVVFEVRFRSHGVGDLFLGTRRDGLIHLDFWDGMFLRRRNVFLWEAFGEVRHDDPFGR